MSPGRGNHRRPGDVSHTRPAIANLKLALRMLVKTPFGTTVAIVSLALGIRANAAIFSLFNQLVLRRRHSAGTPRLEHRSDARPARGMTSVIGAPVTQSRL